jgi:hypothetical protein
MTEDEERRLVAPVDIVEDDDQPALRGGALQRLGHIIEDAEPVLRRLDVTTEHAVWLDSQRAQHLPPRPERRRTLSFPASSPRDRGTAGEGDPSELLGESGLADAGLAWRRERGDRFHGGRHRATPATLRARAAGRRCRRRSRARDCPSSVLHAPQACPAAPDCGSDAALGQTDSNFAIVTREARPAFPRCL